MAGQYDHLSDKALSYAEGVVAGFAEAQAAIERLTGGLITLNMPPAVRRWDDIIRETRGTRRRMSPDDAT